MDVTMVFGILTVLFGYLLGAIPFGLLLAKWTGGIDIRRYGSGKVGATNVLRTMGWKASAVVFACDILKAVIPVIAARILTGSAWWESAAALAAIAGHCWSIYIGWTGG